MPNKIDETWVTEKGEAILVGALQEDHCRNVLRLVLRQIREGDMYCLGGHQHRINIARAVAELDSIQNERG